MLQPFTLFSDPSTQAARRPTALQCTWDAGGPAGAWLRATGELDLASAAHLQEALNRATRDAHVVVLDLRELHFMDVAGVRAIVHASTQVRAAGRRMLLLTGSHRLQRMLFALPGVAEHLETVTLDSRPIALAPAHLRRWA